MNAAEVMTHLRTLSYPGWGFEVVLVGDEGDVALYRLLANLHTHVGDVVLDAHFAAPESSDPPGRERTVELVRGMVINPADVRDVEDLENRVFGHIAEIYLHEVRELVKFGGRAPFHPHRPDGRARFDGLVGRVPAV